MIQFTQHTGIVLPLDISDIDTDTIIPKQFLQATTRSDFGLYLFFNWRFLENTPQILNPNFVLNDPHYKHATILLTRRNFGCGSSREHAVWALMDYGFKVIIAPSFADIFHKNSFNNRLLLITLSELKINDLFKEISTQKKGISFTVNLHEQMIYVHNKKKYFFEINDFHRRCMLNKIDNISLTLQYDAAIKKYENNQPSYLK
ncbi:3-isopropylmalate dehydratase small subunit [Candidatus Blochmanniella camponoti]|uniref:3-isopropylmalate dehydratase small subunit n=1 Tax=Candidatus Blochmanniella camponoti TaxID=108080 RepID=A0AAE9L6G0_9ENTR|nr:3-isopropylmalate dehydratase small subunit [Candidatus Blochmannia herculeanus]URJ24567.1 3-isopropylmalate dehydratase small subunit [Candidatus Blochmannia herculeanus]URJ26825.1 3-isopropylmalate dehydratase small subunit [Candidatus Blochmannia herculeanus]URJ27370.1 3-isopropylmalate dehydratase small subunit [Candidatus Blochmannia herculeanus]